MKKIAKILSIVLCLAMVLSFSSMAFAAEEATFTLVEDASSLKAGDRIIITANYNGVMYAAGAIADGKTIMSSVETSLDNMSADVVVFTLGGEAGAWTLTSEQGQLYTNGNKKLNYEADGNGTWDITIADGAATITNTASPAEKPERILYNGGSPRFTTYNSATNDKMLLPSIYLVNGEITTEPTAPTEPETPVEPETVEQLQFVSNPVAGTAYKFGMTQVKNNVNVYVDGGINQDRYLTTTENAADAILFYAEAVEGGFKFYTEKDGTKLYLLVGNNDAGKMAIKYAAEGSVFVYEETCKIWTTDIDGTAYYMGSYNTFNTISASKTSYINAENTCVSQFPLGLVAVENETPVEPPVEPEKVEQLQFVSTPVAGAAYKFGMTQVKNNVNVYVDGGINQDRYLTTTESIDDAIIFYAEPVEGGFKFYTEKDGTKLYLLVGNNDAGKMAIKYAAEGSVFVYEETCKIWTTDVNGTAYYMGSYNTFNTISASKTSYINAENTCVSQFPLGLIAVEAPSAPCEHTGGTATCKDLAVCELCGEAYGELAAHSFAEGKCTVCGAADPDYVAPNEPTTEATKPEVEPAPGGDSAGTGDMFGVVVALMAASGVALVVLKKKEN